MPCTIEMLQSCRSTNSELASRVNLPHGYLIATYEQTAGRGQRGNSWEAQPGKNLTFSILLRPGQITPARQFELSMLISLAIADVVDEALGSNLVQIKWPNDIYVGDSKICGILIENAILGNHIEQSIAGIGLNVNQMAFTSDAPNPASMAQIAGHYFPLDALLNTLADRIIDYVDTYTLADFQQMKSKYMNRLWRREGTHKYRDHASGKYFFAEIIDISSSGLLTLSNGSIYAFKEVEFIL